MSASTPDLVDVETVLRDYLLEHSSVNVSGGIDPQENLLDSGILDSLGIAEITEFIEAHFSVVIDEDEISSQNYKTLSALSQFCHSKITAAAA
ncbi:acyl carrier protein [Stappia sp.]|uniref:acyl carrier protein n=1 Tax=Stappia sp. TaxID=1870903 RepID=UPI003A9A4429